jgi:hypothetical protein
VTGSPFGFAQGPEPACGGRESACATAKLRHYRKPLSPKQPSAGTSRELGRSTGSKQTHGHPQPFPCSDTLCYKTWIRPEDRKR